MYVMLALRDQNSIRHKSTSKLTLCPLPYSDVDFSSGRAFPAGHLKPFHFSIWHNPRRVCSYHLPPHALDLNASDAGDRLSNTSSHEPQPSRQGPDTQDVRFVQRR